MQSSSWASLLRRAQASCCSAHRPLASQQYLGSQLAQDQDRLPGPGSAHDSSCAHSSTNVLLNATRRENETRAVETEGFPGLSSRGVWYAEA